MSARSSGKQHFLVLDGMRGIAALIVVWLHAAQLMQGRHGVGHAYLAVDFFFCLSGFVIAYAYDARLSSDMTFADFVKLRLIRLYPVIFVGCVLGGLVMVVGNGLVASAIFTVAAMLLLPVGMFDGRQAYPVNNPLWSLFFEIVANFAFALLPGLTVRTWAVIVAVLAISYAAVCIGFDGIQKVGYQDWSSFAAGFIRAGYPFAAGVLIFRLGLHRRSGVPAAVPLIGLPLLLLLPSYYPTLEGMVIGLLFVPALVAFGAQSRPSTAGRSILSVLGEVSYPLYLIHHPIIRALRHFPLEGRFGWAGSYILPAIGLVVSVIAAMIVSRVYDQPVRRWLSDTFAGPKIGGQFAQQGLSRARPGERTA